MDVMASHSKDLPSRGLRGPRPPLAGTRTADSTGMAQETREQAPPGHPPSHPLPQKTVYYLRRSNYGVGTFSHSNSSPLVRRPIHLLHPRPTAHTSASSLPVPHFRALTSGLSLVWCQRPPTPQARGTLGVKVSQLGDIKWNEGKRLHLTTC